MTSPVFQGNLAQEQRANTPEFQSYVTQQKALSEQLNAYMQQSPLYQQHRDLDAKMSSYMNQGRPQLLGFTDATSEELQRTGGMQPAGEMQPEGLKPPTQLPPILAGGTPMLPAVRGGIGGIGGGGGQTNVSLNLQGSATMNPQGGGQNKGYSGWTFAEGGSVSQGLASLGRGQDSMLVHMTPGEVGGLQQLAMAHGGSLTINPQTGLPEAGFLSKMLPMLAAAAAIYATGGAAAPAVLGAEGAGLFGMGAAATGALAGGATGYLMDPQHRLMSAISGGLSGYGASGLMSGLSGMGEAAIGNQAMQIEGAAGGSDANLVAAKQAAVQDFAAKPLYSQLGSGVQAAAFNPMAFVQNNYKSLAAASAPLVSNMLQQQPTLANLPKQNIPFKTYDFNQGEVNPNFGQPGQPYFLNRGFTRTGAEGGLFYNTENEAYPQARLPLQHMAGGGRPGEAPRFSRDVYSNAAGAGPNSDDPEEGPYSDSPGVGINTPAIDLPAIAKARAATMTIAQLERAVQEADTAPEQDAALKRLQLVEAKLRPAKSTYTRAAGGGLMGLNEYAAGGKLLRGAGDGMSDSIPAVIKGAKPQRAALADGEFVIPADVVSHLGNGSTEAGAKRLYSMMDKVRHARTGNPKQGKQINPDRFMPA